jgi:type IV fimbrial biogenesis protein FimT
MNRSKSRGLTFIELFIVLAVLSILLSWALPSVRGSLARNQMLGQANELAGALALARSEAVTRGLQAGVCASSDGVQCSGSATDWASNYIVFIDEDNGSDFDGGEPMLKSFRGHAEVTQNAAATAFYFTPEGFSTSNAVATVQVCHENTEEYAICREVSISPSGTIGIHSDTPST